VPQAFSSLFTLHQAKIKLPHAFSHQKSTFKHFLKERKCFLPNQASLHSGKPFSFFALKFNPREQSRFKPQFTVLSRGIKFNAAGLMDWRVG
jgi:hypothetical protein